MLRNVFVEVCVRVARPGKVRSVLVLPGAQRALILSVHACARVTTTLNKVASNAQPLASISRCDTRISPWMDGP